MSEKAILKTLLWSIFSATLAVTALTLPVHIFASSHGKTLAIGNELLQRAVLLVIFLSALYLAIYRIYTLLLDLGFEQHEKSVRGVCIFIFIGMIAGYAFGAA